MRRDAVAPRALRGLDGLPRGGGAVHQHLGFRDGDAARAGLRPGAGHSPVPPRAPRRRVHRCGGARRHHRLHLPRPVRPSACPRRGDDRPRPGYARRRGGLELPHAPRGAVPRPGLPGAGRLAPPPPPPPLPLWIVAVGVPPQRRGMALGAVMGAFSVAAVIGVLLSLQLSVWGGWRLPFLVVGGLGLAVTAAVVASLPSLRGHLARPAEP